jgi:hypothetical protein
MKSLMSVLEATISGAQGSSVLLRNGLVAPSEADVAGRQILDFHAIPGGPAKGHGVLRMTKYARSDDKLSVVGYSPCASE